MRCARIAAVVLLVLSATSAVAGEQSRRPQRWWQSTEVRALLELSDDQSERLDKIYRRTLPKQRESMRRLNAEERTLSLLISDMNVEEIDVTRQVDRLEAARSELNKTRTLMVFRMYRVLTERQHARLKAWMEDDDPEDEDSARRRRC